MALEPVEGVSISVDLAGVPVHAHLWLAKVGRIELYLSTPMSTRTTTSTASPRRLYGGGVEERSARRSSSASGVRHRAGAAAPGFT
jgi:hypothetical protein